MRKDRTWDLKFGLAGVYGQRKTTSTEFAGTGGNKNANVWMGQFNFFWCPIIPENNMNKTDALLFDGVFRPEARVTGPAGSSARHYGGGLVASRHLRPNGTPTYSVISLRPL